MLARVIQKLRRIQPQPTRQPELEEVEPIQVRRFSSSLRLNVTPRLVFFGGEKGGAGKSFLASASVVVSSVSRRPLYAVDTDVGNATLTTALLRGDEYSEIIRYLNNRNIDDYANFASAIMTGKVPQLVPRIRGSVENCKSIADEYAFFIIMPYNIVRMHLQLRQLRNVDSALLRAGAEELAGFLKQATEKRNGIALIDSKPRSAVGINYEPVYSVFAEESDVFIAVTEVSHLSTAVLSHYALDPDKTIVVVNKFRHRQDIELRLTEFLTDIVSRGYRFLIVPELPEDSKLYTLEGVCPARRSLRYRSAHFAMALMYLAGVIDEAAIERTGCWSKVRSILETHEAIAEKLR